MPLGDIKTTLKEKNLKLKAQFPLDFFGYALTYSAYR